MSDDLAGKTIVVTGASRGVGRSVVRHLASRGANLAISARGAAGVEETAAELEQMKALVARAMEDGALGLSTSLQYVPDRFANTDEIVALASAAGPSGARP